jgi:hypothetical protein
MTSMLVQSAREAASSSMGVGPCPGSSSPDAMFRRPWAVAPSSSRPSFFQLTTTGSLVAMLSLASSTGGARGRLRCLHWYTVR